MELEHGTAPEDSLELGPAEDEPRPPPLLCPSLSNGPAPAHPQVGTNYDAAFEAEQEVLADGFNRLEPTPVQFLGDPIGLGPRMRSLDLEPLADERLQAERRAVKRVAFRHSCGSDSRPRFQGLSTARRGPARKPASRSKGIASLSVTGSPSNRSTASRLAPPPCT